MAKIGRNEPCPCGSGKKYKQCCLAKDEAAAPTTSQPPSWRRDYDNLVDLIASRLLQENELDDAANAVAELIGAGKLDEVEHAAADLLERFPDGHIAYDRLARACEDRGHNHQAAEFYRKVILLAQENPEIYEPEFEQTYQQLIDQLSLPPDVR